MSYKRMKTKFWLKIGAIFILAVLAVIAVMPKGPDIDFRKVGIGYIQELDFKLGLDLQGGTHLVYDIDTSKIAEQDRGNAVEALKLAIDKRVNAFGVSEPLIYTSKSGTQERLVVELAGVKDPKEAIDLIGKTAKLEFKVQDGETQGQYKSWSPELTGNFLNRANPQTDPQTGKIFVELEFNTEGAKIFGDLTRQNLQKPVAIYLDDQLVTAPTVQTEILDGRAQITGEYDQKSAKNLATQLNAGALPMPINIVEQRTVSATLGKEAIEKSLVAAAFGILIVALFMIFYYRLPGFIASIALAIYILFTLAIFKGGLVLIQPFTLTLAGIAGFVLSVGMAVDANILIFERIKEELRAGRNLKNALDEGVRRAWSSIRDSNVATWITCAILYTFGSSLLKGFALTLALGVAVSMFTAIVITKNFLKIVVNNKRFEGKKWWGI